MPAGPQQPGGYPLAFARAGTGALPGARAVLRSALPALYATVLRGGGGVIYNIIELSLPPCKTALLECVWEEGGLILRGYLVKHAVMY